MLTSAYYVACVGPPLLPPLPIRFYEARNIASHVCIRCHFFHPGHPADIVKLFSILFFTSFHFSFPPPPSSTNRVGSLTLTLKKVRPTSAAFPIMHWSGRWHLNGKLGKMDLNRVGHKLPSCCGASFLPLLTVLGQVMYCYVHAHCINCL